MECVTVSLIKDHIYNWEFKIMGPDGSPYEGGVFVLGIECLPDHPRTSPEIEFKTKIYQPNVYADALSA